MIMRRQFYVAKANMAQRSHLKRKDLCTLHFWKGDLPWLHSSQPHPQGVGDGGIFWTHPWVEFLNSCTILSRCSYIYIYTHHIICAIYTPGSGSKFLDSSKIGQKELDKIGQQKCLAILLLPAKNRWEICVIGSKLKNYFHKIGYGHPP